jgi:hypothetical protein
MKALTLLFTIAVFIHIFSGCAVTQGPEKVLLNYETRKGAGFEKKVYTKSFTVGGTNALPVKCTWEVYRDSAGCFKFSSLKFERTGGNPNHFITAIGYRVIVNCVSDFNSKDTTGFQYMVISYDYEIGKTPGVEIRAIDNSLEVDTKGRLVSGGEVIN